MGNGGDASLSLGYTALNEFAAYDSREAALDYESVVLNLSFSYRLRDNLLLAADSRIISFYGGFFDGFIEGFHELFGFPNAGREFFRRNGLVLNVDNGGGRDLIRSSGGVFPGDGDLALVYTFRDDSRLKLAGAAALKLPLGSVEGLCGSGYADLGAQFLMEWIPRADWSVHLQAGLVLPGDLVYDLPRGDYASLVSFQNLLALEFRPSPAWSLIVQSRIHSSPIWSERRKTYTTIGTINLFTLPQTNLLIGARYTRGAWAFQAHFEEDPLTYEGPDIVLVCRGTYFWGGTNR